MENSTKSWYAVMTFNGNHSKRELPYIWPDIQHRKRFVWHWGTSGVNETINLRISVIHTNFKLSKTRRLLRSLRIQLKSC